MYPFRAHLGSTKTHVKSLAARAFEKADRNRGQDRVLNIDYRTVFEAFSPSLCLCGRAQGAPASTSYNRAASPAIPVRNGNPAPVPPAPTGSVVVALREEPLELGGDGVPPRHLAVFVNER